MRASLWRCTGDFDFYSFAILIIFVVTSRLNGLGTCKLFDLGLCRAKIFSVACVENIFGIFAGYSSTLLSCIARGKEANRNSPNKTETLLSLPQSKCGDNPRTCTFSEDKYHHGPGGDLPSIRLTLFICHWCSDSSPLYIDYHPGLSV